MQFWIGQIVTEVANNTEDWWPSGWVKPHPAIVTDSPMNWSSLEFVNRYVSLFVPGLLDCLHALTYRTGQANMPVQRHDSMPFSLLFELNQCHWQMSRGRTPHAVSPNALDNCKRNACHRLDLKIENKRMCRTMWLTSRASYHTENGYIVTGNQNPHRTYFVRQIWQQTMRRSHYEILGNYWKMDGAYEFDFTLPFCPCYLLNVAPQNTLFVFAEKSPAIEANPFSLGRSPLKIFVWKPRLVMYMNREHSNGDRRITKFSNTLH